MTERDPVTKELLDRLDRIEKVITPKSENSTTTSSQGLPKPKWSLLIEILAPASLFLAFIPILAIALVILSSRAVLVYRAFWLQMGFAILALVSAILITRSILRRWYKDRGQLSEIDHSMIVLVIAIGYSITISSTNYLLYTFDSTAFALDPASKEYYQSQHTNSVANSLNSEMQVTNLTAHLLAALKTRPNSLPLLIRPHAPISLGSCQLWIAKVKMDVGGSMGSTEITSYELVASMAGRATNLDVNFGEPNEPGETFILTRKELSDKILHRQETARRRIVDLVEYLKNPPTYRLPFWLFVYQDLMAVLQTSAKIYTPNSSVSRLVAVFAAAAKYAIFGIFVSIAVRLLSRRS